MNRVGGFLPFAVALSLLAGNAARAESSAKEQGCVRENFRLIVDVGHSAESPGAMSARGVTEFEFNLRLGQIVEKALVEAGFSKTVLLVSTGKSKPSMYQRVARVNEMTADLLLSIHYDAVPNSFLEKWEYDGKPRFYSDRFKGHSIFVSEENVDLKSSLVFAHLLGEQLKARDMEYTPHYTETFMGKFRRTLIDAMAGVYRYDTLWLLKKSRTPAVLLEAGSIVNRDEEVLLGAPERQTLVSAAVMDAVDQYCVAHQQTPQLMARSHVSQAARARPKPHRRVAETPDHFEVDRYATPVY